MLHSLQINVCQILQFKGEQIGQFFKPALLYQHYTV